jgi:hypothetical protein
MGRPPIAVIVAAILTGLQGMFVVVVSGFFWLWGSGWERDTPVPERVNVGLALIAFIGVLVIIGAIMMLSGSYRWAVAVVAFEVLLIAWLMAPQLGKHSDIASYRSVLSPGGLAVLIWILGPLICLLLPSSRRWFRRA